MHFYEKETISLYLDELEILEDIITEKQKVKIYSHPPFRSNIDNK